MYNKSYINKNKLLEKKDVMDYDEKVLSSSIKCVLMKYL